MENYEKKSVSSDLKYFGSWDDNAWIEVSEWHNGEGWDIAIETKNGSKLFQLHYSELEAINYLTKHLEYNGKI